MDKKIDLYEKRLELFNTYIDSDTFLNTGYGVQYWIKNLMLYSRAVRNCDTYKELDKVLNDLFTMINNNFSSMVWGDFNKASKILREVWKQGEQNEKN